MLTGQEAVQLYEQLEIDIITLRRLAVCAANMMSVEVDTYREPHCESITKTMALRRVVSVERPS